MAELSYTMTKQLTIFCLVKGDPTSRAFPLTVSSTETVGHLKKLIKVEMAVEFSDVNANALTLRRVSVAVADYDEDSPILLDSLNEKKKLHPTSNLVKVFGYKVPEESIHIIVQRPAAAVGLIGVSGYRSKLLTQSVEHSSEYKLLAAGNNDSSSCQEASHGFFTGWQSLPTSGNVDRDGFLLCTSGFNARMFGYTSGILRSKDHKHNKYGRGKNTVLIPVMEDESYNIQGAEKVWFMDMPRLNVKRDQITIPVVDVEMK